MLIKYCFKSNGSILKIHVLLHDSQEMSKGIMKYIF